MVQLLESLTSYLPYNEKSDQELSCLIAGGDELAFRELYHRLLPYLKGMGMKLLKSEDRVAEVLQESLIRLWVHREKLYAVEAPRAWVFRIFSNECFRYLKKYGLPPVRLELLPESTLPEAAGGPEQRYELRETRHIIRDAVRSLSPRQREIYQLSRERGLKVSEIAAELGLASKYVKKTLMTALHNVRQQLLKSGKTWLLAAILFVLR
ncbi:MAG TPA: sigma-70 family RNA polymerase sigma factor [Puia sp.]|nr:sigma-70 family RNA polymerase sigma factor [Puia sp.]